MYKNKFINQIINKFFFYYKSILNEFFFDTVGWRQYVYVRVSMYSHDDNYLNSIFKALIARFVFLIVNFFFLVSDMLGYLIAIQELMVTMFHKTNCIGQVGA